MADYTMAQAKRDFERGFLKSFELQRVSLGGGWAVLLNSGFGMDSKGTLVDSRTKETRFFKTADAAFSAIEQIGFRFSFLVAAS